VSDWLDEPPKGAAAAVASAVADVTLATEAEAAELDGEVTLNVDDVEGDDVSVSLGVVLVAVAATAL
jgi:hypothetical protein